MLAIAIAVLAAFANAAIGVLVWSFNTKSTAARYFLGLTLSLAIWIGCTYYSLHALGPEEALFWARAVMATAVAQVLFFYLFITTFPDRNTTLKRRALYGIFASALLVGVVALSPFLFQEMAVQPNGNYSPVPGPGMLLFLPFALGFLGMGIWSLAKKYRSAHGLRHTQTGLLVAGVVPMFLLIVVFNLVLPLLAKSSVGVSLSPLFTVIFVGFTAYAIIAKQLFDIRVVIKRTVIFAALLTFTFAVYTAIIVALSSLFQQETGNARGLIINLVAALAVGFSFEPMRRWISERTDKWLFKKEYEQQVVIKDISKKLNDVIALDEALEIMMQTIVKVLHLKHAVTYVFQPGENNTFGVKRVKQVGYSTSARLILEEKDFTVQYFAEHGSTLLVRDMQLELEREQELLKHNPDSQFVRQHAIKQAVYQKMVDLEAAVVIPLHLNSQPLGLIILSEKLSGEGYRAEDLSLLEVVGGQAISSIQKAKLYEGDQMKSEFVSIASHELLTPISAIEGYLSMILEENIGQVDEQARNYLGKVYTSARRLSLLIKDLLSVSRIESGKMKIEQQQLDMNKMVTDTIDQLRFMAADKGLALNYTPTPDLPPAWADPDRTMQVLVNLVSNGIKYTKNGSITISTSVDEKDGFLKTSVTDTGIGMNKSQMQHLFTRFYRVDSPETTGIVGTGLGLYITKSIIEKMGGSIECKSTPGQGSTFSFTLPLFKVETSELG